MKKQTKPDENVKVPDYQRLTEGYDPDRIETGGSGCFVVIAIALAHLMLLVVVMIANSK